MHEGLSSRPVVLAFTRWYLPGYQAGGPIRTLSNMVDRLGDQLDFRIVTQDRDLNDQAAYPGIDATDWNPQGHSHVRYLARPNITLRSLVRIIREVTPDVLYLNSFFDPLLTQRVLLLRRLGLLADIPVVLAPRGEFSAGAIALKSWKKNQYLRASRWLGLYDGLIWQASSDLERHDILRWLPQIDSRSVKLASNLAATAVPVTAGASARKEGDPLKVCFLSRISPMKNLDFALTALGRTRADVILTIHGPREDQAYWATCETLCTSLPDNVQVRYSGEVEYQNVVKTLSSHDLFFFPTRGENYGHVIQEALAAGLPVLISDQTPWRDLEKNGVGWALPLDEPAAFARIIDAVAAWPIDHAQTIRERANTYARNKANDSDVVRANLELFRRVLKR
ncbi:MAG TPA: glycosyltransferase family 4 protein [Chiayiivirga sp.]|jgi:glycosyltransferase involved in cell wall biosynthesis|nr:glycosyltransferase family 4 protein [Chiayiivirga sp.]